MFVNCHAHIFNLKSVFTDRTLETLVNRIRQKAWPEFVTTAFDKALRKALAGKCPDEDALLRELADSLSIDKGLAKFMGLLKGGIPADLQVLLGGDTAGLETDALRELLRKLGDRIDDNHDADHETLTDLIAFAGILLLPTINRVASNLMRQIPADAGAVALMMDITEGGTADEALFEAQIEDTSRAVLAFPGRLFPFVAVNPMRTSHYKRMASALMEKGFVGVKLYPSLGYPLDSDEMGAVFDYCAEHSVPLLQHCNDEGFRFDVKSADYCHPRHWRPILQKHPDLRICFGHFGGVENLAAPTIRPKSWTGQILALMDDFERVYADIAYHTVPMQGGRKQDKYFKNMRTLLTNSTYGSRVLFGTDYHLVRQRLREDNHWRYWQSQFSEEEFRQIAEVNAARFLGLPDAAGAGAQPNIERHLEFIYAKRYELESIPAPWVAAAVRQTRGGNVSFEANSLGGRWSKNNEAHYWVWQFWRGLMRPEHENLPFTECGGLLMRQMVFWNKEHEASEIFEAKCMEQAENMNTFFLDERNAGAAFEREVDRRKAEAAMCEVIRNGDSRLADLAPVVDALYCFKQERS